MLGNDAAALQARLFDVDQVKSLTNFEAAGLKFALLSFIHFGLDGHGANNMMVQHARRRICIPIQMCKFDMREDANNHMTDSSNFPQGNVCKVFGIPFHKGFCIWETSHPKVLFRQFVSAVLEEERERLCVLSTLAVVVAEAARISFCTLSFCFPLMAFSWFSFNADILPFFVP